MNEEITVQKEEEEEEEEVKFRLRTIISDQDVMILRKESSPVVFVIDDNNKASLDEDTKKLIQALKNYVIENDGLGMAGVQLGETKRVFVMRWPFNSDKIVTIINPRLIRGEGHSVKAEGCFSIPDLPSNVKGARVRRMSRIFIDYTNEEGVNHEEEMLIGMDARVFLHELDHLNGFLCLDDKTPTGEFRGWQRQF